MDGAEDATNKTQAAKMSYDQLLQNAAVAPLLFNTFSHVGEPTRGWCALVLKTLQNYEPINNGPRNGSLFWSR